VSITDANHWREANQRFLISTLARVRKALERHAGTPPEERDDTPPSEPDVAMPVPAALETLCAAFDLSPFERDVLLMCAGVELDSGFAAAVARTGREHPTFGLALAALPEAHWSALTPEAPLRYWRLVEASGDSLTSGPLRVDERVLHHLAGVPYLDERLLGIVDPVREEPGELPPSHRALAERISALLLRARGPRPAVQLLGDEPSDARTIAAAACAALGLRLYAARAADLPSAPTEQEALARLWDREAVLSGGILFLDRAGGKGDAAPSLAERVRGVLFVAGREPLRPSGRPAVRLDVPRLGTAERRSLWEDALRPLGDGLNGRVDSLVAQFDLGPQSIRAVGAEVVEGSSRSPEETRAALWDACRVQARGGLEGLAQHIEPAAGWEDLVLPEPQRQTLREISSHVRQRTKVYEAWGFAKKGSRGLGIGALFAGESGTGKTMAAEVLANGLRLDLYRVDLSQVVSKYIGETEENLRRVFDAAEAGGVVLLFDEADALFGKRSEVKDSHDRYANIEVSYLLQRMETYRGLAILTTNMKEALDRAFLRRLRFVVRFPFPDAAMRAEIWRKIFPAATPIEDLDFDKLARLNVAGGNIRNIALGGAFLAADEDEPVRMSHLRRAARGEYAKLEKPLTESGDWT
jgi:hypothetical protein